MGNLSITDPEVQCLRERERLLCRVRYLAALLILGMAMIFDPLTWAGALVLAGVAFGVSIRDSQRLARVRDLSDIHRLRTCALGADAAIAGLLFVLFAFDPDAMPIALFPFLVFRLAVHYGLLGALLGVVVFFGVLTLRMHLQANVLAEGQLRPPLLLLWCSLVILLIAFSREVRVHERARRAVLRERQRIANGFRETIETILARYCVPADAPNATDVHAALRAICEDGSIYRRALANQITELLASASSDLGLTRREQQTLELLGRGRTYAQIAAELFVTESTVRNHAHNIRRKLGLSTKAELVAFAADFMAQRAKPRRRVARPAPEPPAKDHLGWTPEVIGSWRPAPAESDRSPTPVASPAAPAQVGGELAETQALRRVTASSGVGDGYGGGLRGEPAREANAPP